MIRFFCFPHIRKGGREGGKERERERERRKAERKKEKDEEAAVAVEEEGEKREAGRGRGKERRVDHSSLILSLHQSTNLIVESVSLMT
jgi:hypothetical protein